MANFCFSITVEGLIDILYAACKQAASMVKRWVRPLI